MRKGNRKAAAHSDDLLSMALVGYESAKEAIDEKMAEIRKMIGGGRQAIAAAVETYTSATPLRPKRRTMSAAGRKRIEAAQRKRWAEKRKADEAIVKAPKVAMAKAAGR